VIEDRGNKGRDKDKEADSIAEVVSIIGVEADEEITAVCVAKKN
jgi:hypothetical protein